MVSLNPPAAALDNPNAAANVANKPTTIGIGLAINTALKTACAADANKVPVRSAAYKPRNIDALADKPTINPVVTRIATPSAVFAAAHAFVAAVVTIAAVLYARVFTVKVATIVLWAATMALCAINAAVTPIIAAATGGIAVATNTAKLLTMFPTVDTTTFIELNAAEINPIDTWATAATERIAMPTPSKAAINSPLDVMLANCSNTGVKA